jgi:hypothetical protein
MFGVEWVLNARWDPAVDSFAMGEAFNGARSIFSKAEYRVEKGFTDGSVLHGMTRLTRQAWARH